MLIQFHKTSTIPFTSSLSVCACQFYNFSASAQHIGEQFSRTHFEPRLVVSGSHEVVRLSRTNINFLTQVLLLFSDSGKTSLYFPLKIPNRELARFGRTSEHNEESRLAQPQHEIYESKELIWLTLKRSSRKSWGGRKENNRRVESSNGKSTSRNNDFSFLY